MPVKATVENDSAAGIVVYRISGHVTMREIVDAAAPALAKLGAGVPYRSLLLFERDADLSAFDIEALKDVLRFGEDTNKRLKLGPRKAAAVLDDSHDAKLVLPLFNALSHMGDGMDLSFELFNEVEPALDYLGIPRETGRAIIARMG